MANLLSWINLGLFLWARSQRFKNLPLHIRLMCLAMVSDLLLVSALVIFRHALSKLSAGMPWTLKVHVPIAVFTLVMYFPTAFTGWQLYKSRTDRRLRARLKFLDKILLPARILTSVTSFLVQYLRV